MANTMETHSLTEFQQRTPDFVRQLQETGTPLTLTVDGQAALVIQDARYYEEMRERLEQLDRAEAVAAVRQSMAEFERGEGLPADEAFETLRQKHGIPR